MGKSVTLNVIILVSLSLVASDAADVGEEF
jgi:hypothetical protein